MRFDPEQRIVEDARTGDRFTLSGSFAESKGKQRLVIVDHAGKVLLDGLVDSSGWWEPEPQMVYEVIWLAEDIHHPERTSTDAADRHLERVSRFLRHYFHGVAPESERTVLVVDSRARRGKPG